jgi:hypothetical protein
MTDDRAETERMRLKGAWPAEFADGERLAFLRRRDGHRARGGYPKNFRAWPLERRNAWFAGFNAGCVERERMEVPDGGR